MIEGIENIGPSLQKAILECIATLFDMSEDIEVEEIDDHVIQINDILYFVVDNTTQVKLITQYNTDRFENFFDDLSNAQLEYVDKDRWIEDYGITTMAEWISEETEYIVDESNYYGSYSFYEVHRV